MIKMTSYQKRKKMYPDFSEYFIVLFGGIICSLSLYRHFLMEKVCALYLSLPAWCNAAIEIKVCNLLYYILYFVLFTLNNKYIFLIIYYIFYAVHILAIEDINSNKVKLYLNKVILIIAY